MHPFARCGVSHKQLYRMRNNPGRLMSTDDAYPFVGDSQGRFGKPAETKSGTLRFKGAPTEVPPTHGIGDAVRQN